MKKIKYNSFVTQNEIDSIILKRFPNHKCPTYVIGRKNWLFNNTPGGARASAVYYSIVATAIENGLNPFEYLRWIFTNAPNLGKPGYAAAIEDLLPGSAKIPQEALIPRPKGTEPEKYAWEED